MKNEMTTSASSPQNNAIYSPRLFGVVIFLVALLYMTLKLAPAYLPFIIAGFLTSAASMSCNFYLVKRDVEPIWLAIPFIILTQGFLIASDRCMPERVFWDYWFYYSIQWLVIWALALITVAVVLAHIKGASS